MTNVTMNSKRTEQIKSAQAVETLRKRMQKELEEKNLAEYRSLVKNLSMQLKVDMLDCAAVLACLHQSGLENKQPFARNKSSNPAVSGQAGAGIRMVRYRIEVGRKHKVSVKDIKKILIDESGVEDRMIGFIDIHRDYTLINLPEGMPTDIFYHMKSLKLNQQSLGFKRIRTKGNSKGAKPNQRGRRRASS